MMMLNNADENLMYKILFVLMIVGVSSCHMSEDNLMWVNSYKVNCGGVGKHDCLLVQKGDTINEDNWKALSVKIEGFEYEPGYIYRISVAEEKLTNLPADAPSIRYALESVVEKVEDRRLLLDGTWDLYLINGESINLRQTGSGFRPQIKINVADKSLSGIDGCNELLGNIDKVTKDQISFGLMASTKMECENMELAERFREVAKYITSYKIKGNTLTFYNKSGDNLMEFRKGDESIFLLNDMWRVETINNDVIKDDEKAPKIEINVVYKEVVGSDGCNSFKGKITTLNNREIQFGVLAGSRKMCSDMHIAKLFNKTMPKVRKYDVTNYKLALMDEYGSVLITLRKAE